MDTMSTQRLNEQFAAHLNAVGLRRLAWEPDPFCPQGHPRPAYAMTGDLCLTCLDAIHYDPTLPQSIPDTYRFRRRARNFARAEVLIPALNAWCDKTDNRLVIIRVPNTDEPWRVQINHRAFWFGITLAETTLAAIVEAITVVETQGHQVDR